MLFSVTAARALAGSVSVSVVWQACFLPSEVKRLFFYRSFCRDSMCFSCVGPASPLPPADGAAANSAWKAWMACSKAAFITL